MWTDESDAKALRVDAIFFENGEKKLLFKTNTDTWRQGLKPMKRIHLLIPREDKGDREGIPHTRPIP